MLACDFSKNEAVLSVRNQQILLSLQYQSNAMSFKNLFKSGEHSRNINHYASLVRLATADKELKEEELTVLARFARKLGVHETEHKAILKNPKAYPIDPRNTLENRLELLHDMFTIIFADNEIDEDEHRLLVRYATALGFSDAQAEKYIDRSIEIYTGGLDLEDYLYLLDRK